MFSLVQYVDRERVKYEPFAPFSVRSISISIAQGAETNLRCSDVLLLRYHAPSSTLKENTDHFQRVMYVSRESVPNSFSGRLISVNM